MSQPGEGHRSHTCLWIFLGIVVLVLGGAWYAYHYVKKTFGDVIGQTREITQEYGAQTIERAKEVLPYYLGFDGSRHFLVLLQNDTELRPTGGFIGSYAIVDVENASVKKWFVEGTERLDARAPSSTVSVAPEPLKKYLAQPVFYFRDANWSPDFPTAVAELEKRYRAESGDTTPFDGVIAVSATAMARMMEHIGPVTADGVTFTPDNFIERLEFEVEYGYEQRGDDFANRKDLMKDLMKEIISVFHQKMTAIWPDLVRTFFDSLEDKHILLFARDPVVQAKILSQNWGGAIRDVPTETDALMVVDANLASLKTDRVISRSIDYRIFQDTDAKIQKTKGAWVAEARITYTHSGTFDWRTSRYRSYTRVYLPAGAQFVSGDGAMERDRSDAVGMWAVSTEFDRPVAAAFFAVEPGKIHTLVVRYIVPDAVVHAIENGTYRLFVQKQAGTRPISLTVSALFDTNVLMADPAEKKEQWGDRAYTVNTEVQKDTTLTVKLAR